MKRLALLFLLLFISTHATDTVELWDYYEITLSGPTSGNPYKEINIKAVFTNDDESFEVPGFYSGNGIYKIRFMPDDKGTWTYKTSSNAEMLNNRKGSFECIPVTGNNHGFVEVDKKFHFSYADGTPYYPFGTTLYSWITQPDSVQEQTLQSLSQSPFNKVRMCVFPQNHYWYEIGEPSLQAFEGSPRNWDFSRFNPDYFDHLEKRILQLRKMNIECDLILFHPYDRDRWGYDQMNADQSDFYVRYLIARFGAFRNIWWSAANEYDLVKNKKVEDWDRILQILQNEDIYQHLRSIHQCKEFYDWTKPWVTHASIQKIDIKMREWLEEFNKPVIVDEPGYEGNFHFTWGDLTPEHMTQQFWDAVTNGGYATHGETYMNPENIFWWSQGGKLTGKSIERIAFLKNIIEGMPRNGLTPFNASPIKWNRLNCARLDDDCFLFYFGERQHYERYIELPEDRQYKVEIIDTWEMTITKVEGLYSGVTNIKLPVKPYMALRVTAVEN